MVVDTHMRILRKKNLRRVDAASQMNFARKYIDTTRVLFSMGPLHVNRFIKEDTILIPKLVGSFKQIKPDCAVEPLKQVMHFVKFNKLSYCQGLQLIKTDCAICGV